MVCFILRPYLRLYWDQGRPLEGALWISYLLIIVIISFLFFLLSDGTINNYNSAGDDVESIPKGDGRFSSTSLPKLEI